MSVEFVSVGKTKQLQKWVIRMSQKRGTVAYVNGSSVFRYPIGSALPGILVIFMVTYIHYYNLGGTNLTEGCGVAAALSVDHEGNVLNC